MLSVRVLCMNRGKDCAIVLKKLNEEADKLDKIWGNL